VQVWCNDAFPRLVQRPQEIALTGKMSKQCACFKEDQVSHPRLEVYEGCDHLAEKCRVWSSDTISVIKVSWYEQCLQVHFIGSFKSIERNIVFPSVQLLMVLITCQCAVLMWFYLFIFITEAREGSPHSNSLRSSPMFLPECYLQVKVNSLHEAF
jgi:hypothetical protein